MLNMLAKLQVDFTLFVKTDHILQERNTVIPV